jgi:hypothetical protein
MAKKPPTSDQNSFSVKGIAITGFFVILIIWLSFMDLAARHWKASSDKIGDFGVFGDSFGVINSLFSGLAMLGVALTLYKQHKDGELADERHDEGIAAQERITTLQGLSSLVDFEKDLYRETSNAMNQVKRIKRSYYRFIKAVDEGYRTYVQFRDEFEKTVLESALYIGPHETEEIIERSSEIADLGTMSYVDFEDITDPDEKETFRNDYKQRKLDFESFLIELEETYFSDSIRIKVLLKRRTDAIEAVLKTIEGKAQEAS